MHPFYVQAGTTNVSLALPGIQQYLSTVRGWYMHGYIPANSGSEAAPTYPSQTTYAVGFGNWVQLPPASVSSQIGYGGGPANIPTAAIPLQERPFFMGQNTSTVISSTSQHPRRAMMLLNLF